MKLAILVSLMGLVVLFGGEFKANAQIVPVALDNSGFLVDAIWETNGSASADLSGDPSQFTSFVLVTDGYAASNSSDSDATGGLPDDGTITSPSGAVFQLQPYDGNNVLVLGQSAGTLTLAPSAQSSYSEISFLVSNLSSDRRSSTISFTLNYTDGDWLTLTTAAPVTNIASAPASDAVAAATLTSYVFAGSLETDDTPLSLVEYDFPVSAPPGEILQSVTIDPGLNQLDVYAISGIDPTPEPPAWTLVALALGGMALLVRRARPPADGTFPAA
jgi:hypothetical protein